MASYRTFCISQASKNSYDSLFSRDFCSSLSRKQPGEQGDRVPFIHLLPLRLPEIPVLHSLREGGDHPRRRVRVVRPDHEIILRDKGYGETEGWGKTDGCGVVVEGLELLDDLGRRDGVLQSGSVGSVSYPVGQVRDGPAIGERRVRAERESRKEKKRSAKSLGSK